MNLSQLAIDHDYYASDSNYYSSEAGKKYDTWADFYEEFHDADVDMNLIYRWDIHEREASKRKYMELFMIHQRKGIYSPIMINYVDEKDVETIIPFMKKHWEKLQSIWNPISKL